MSKSAVLTPGQIALRDATIDHERTPMTLVPGKRRLLPGFNRATGNFFVTPVVEIARVAGQSILKLPGGTVARFPADAAIEDCSLREWARCLWGLSAAQSKAATPSRFA